MLKVSPPPHIRSRETNQTMMMDVVFALVLLYAMATYYYGARAILLGLIGVVSCIATELVCQLLLYKVPNIRDLSGVITGLIIPLLMPASIRWEIVLVSCIFAIAVAKFPFGGVGENVFNPAVSGVAFAMICWPGELFTYPVPFSHLPFSLTISEEIRTVASPARMLMLGGVPTTEPLDILLGNCPGPMGATSLLVLLTCLIYLSVRRAASLPMTISFFAGATLVAAVAPRAALGPFESVMYEIMSGMMAIGAVILINDPVTSPKRWLPRLIYGFMAGALCVVFRHLGRFEESLLFAILIMNAFVWIVDLWGEWLAHFARRKNHYDKFGKEIPPGDEENVGDA